MSLEKHQEAVRLHVAGKTREALRLLGQVLAEAPTSDVWNDWATMQAANGGVDDAEEGYRQALALDRKNVQAAANLGFLLAALKRDADAIDFLEAALAGGSTEPRVPSTL